MTKFLQLDNCYINIETGEIINTLTPEPVDVSDAIVDPLGIKLLMLLAKNQGELISKETLLAELWPDTVVNEDAWPRCISRVRKLIGDQPRQPKFIETLPKRGYRLIATEINWVDSVEHLAPIADKNIAKYIPKKPSYLFYLTLLVLVLVGISFYFFEQSSTPAKSEASQLVQQADVYYHKVTRQDNEMALELYQKAIALSPDSAIAHSGLANSLVQRAIRLPSNENTWPEMSLGRALSDGRLFSETSKRQLNKAQKLSEKAIQLSPNDARAHKALGFVLSAQNKLDAAIGRYEAALLLNPNAWDVHINLGDIYEIRGQLTRAISYYKKAFTIMGNKNDAQFNLSRQWQAKLGAGIGDKYYQQNNLIEAEIWFRHVLSFAPFSPQATKGLANVLTLAGQLNESERLCSKYLERIGQAICD